MTESEVAATQAPAPKRGRWRRLARIAAVLAIPIAATLSGWSRPRSPDAARVEREITHPAPGDFVVPKDAESGSYVTVNFLIQVRRTGLCALHVEFCKYRGLYRQVGVPLLTLCLITLPCWVAFRVYRRRTLERPPSARRELLLLTAVVYLLCLVTLTLTPNRNSRLRAESAPAAIELRPNLTSLTCPSASVSSARNARTFCLQNAAGNVALFFPLGVLLPLVWSGLRFRHGIQIAIAVSLGIELVQYLSTAWGSYRTADVNDVVLNGFGACLGLALGFLLRSRGATPVSRRV